ncbi:hypothetical protein H9Q72_005458 [Fusarium xylarioides]|uniref:Uncharacterized protein n=1 Tax=Fusarium xylarioides TaxID=221167 RepID=A0A9P7I2J9_9HYPO|nr:hypothetical protein H9Q70_010747 [Fusarium xylarioides]KAG5766464.1 hypothetical protein H9Q72_005458 [Fusarium xylarioides]
MRNLEIETNKDKSLTKFLERASLGDTASPRLSPKEWLEQLTMVDFSNHVAITHHRFGLVTDLLGRFDLVTDDDMDTFAVAPYPGALSTEELLLSRRRSSPQVMLENLDPHPSLVSLQIGDAPSIYPIFETPTIVVPSVSGQPLPSLVLPVGQLQKKSDAKKSNVYLDTDYVLVIDAVTAEHPVWLVYDRNPLDDMGERERVNPDQQPLVFKGVGKNFDAVQIFPSIQGWIDSYENPDPKVFQDAIKKTGIIAPVKAAELTLADAAKLFLK